MQVEAISSPRPSVANPWLALFWWTLATTVAGVLCLPVAEALGLPVVWGLAKATAGGLPEAIATGAIIGLAQWLVLRAYLPGRALWLWPIITALGLVLGIIAWAQVSVPINRLNLHVVLGFAVSGAIQLAGVGLCQGLLLLLTLGVRGVAWWLPATILAGAAFWPTRNGLSLILSQTFGNSLSVVDTQTLAGRISITIAFIVYGAITGLALALLLRKRSRTIDDRQ